MQYSHNTLFRVIPILCWLIVTSAPALGQDSPAVIAIINRLERLQNWTAQFDTETVSDIDPNREMSKEEQASIRDHGLNEKSNQHVIFRFLNGQEYVEVTLDAKMMEAARIQGLDDTLRRTRSLLPDRMEDLFQKRLDSRVGGVIEDRGFVPIPEEWAFDEGVGVRLHRSNEALLISELEHAKYVVAQDGKVTITIEHSDRIRHELCFDKQLKYALISYRAVYPFPDEYEEIECSDFRAVNELFLPYKIVRQSTMKDTAGKIRHTYTRTMTVQKFVVGDMNNTNENMFIKWPKGAMVRDMRSDVLMTMDKAQSLTDADIAGEIERQQHVRQGVEGRAQERIDHNLVAPTTSPSR